MRISAVNSSMYSQRSYDASKNVRVHSLKCDNYQSMPTGNNVAFKGWLGGLLGGSVGAIIGCALAPVTGGLSLALAYYGGLAVGAAAGNKIEEKITE